MVLKSNKIRVGISVGDPNGIGFEIILKTFQDKKIYDFFIPIVFAHPKNFIEEQKSKEDALKDLTMTSTKELNSMLNKLVKAESYEAAAKIRDELSRRR